MTLYFIGLGLGDCRDITLKGMEAVKKSSRVYFEAYTSLLNCSLSELEKLYGRKVEIADRELVEKHGDRIVEEASSKDVAFLVVGDPFCATTHQDLKLRAAEKGVEVRVIHNASIISAIGEIGLDVYKYGRITTIPFQNRNIKSPVEVFRQNFRNGMHTLFLLDLEPANNKFMKVNEAIAYLLENGVEDKVIGIGIAGLGTEKCQIKRGTLYELKGLEFTSLPQCLVMPGKMHFMEEECIKQQGL
ncbi:diphthine synthase [Candidatus Woesearchaeota archaeon]|nr:diphthine synthase [Candidatus Woesearchaeota archaeon]